MPPPRRRLRLHDLLYRAVRPGEYDARGLRQSAFEYTGVDRSTGLPSPTLSFSAKGEATPADALAAISRQGIVRRLCGTGKAAPSPAETYRRGFRVAALSARYVLEACRLPDAVVRIVADHEGNEVEPNGHVQLHGGARLSRVWARRSRILDGGETLTP